eukprot:1621712-Rhodomonas_salina.1
MSGTGIPYGASVLCDVRAVASYAVSGTDIAYGSSVYAMPGTDVGYGATRVREVMGIEGGHLSSVLEKRYPRAGRPRNQTQNHRVLCRIQRSCYIATPPPAPETDRDIPIFSLNLYFPAVDFAVPAVSGADRGDATPRSRSSLPVEGRKRSRGLASRRRRWAPRLSYARPTKCP